MSVVRFFVSLYIKTRLGFLRFVFPLYTKTWFLFLSFSLVLLFVYILCFCVVVFFETYPQEAKVKRAPKVARAKVKQEVKKEVSGVKVKQEPLWEVMVKEEPQEAKVQAQPCSSLGSKTTEGKQVPEGGGGVFGYGEGGAVGGVFGYGEGGAEGGGVEGYGEGGATPSQNINTCRDHIYIYI